MPGTVRIAAELAANCKALIELKSKPFDPHPMFTSFIKAAVD